MSAHTPGPWRFRDPEARGVAGRWAVTANGSKVAICELNHYRSNCEADARLIAAATEILDALRDCVTFIERDLAPETARMQRDIAADVAMRIRSAA